jgi:hypothetical protein
LLRNSSFAAQNVGTSDRSVPGIRESFAAGGIERLRSDPAIAGFRCVSAIQATSAFRVCSVISSWIHSGDTDAAPRLTLVLEQTSYPQIAALPFLTARSAAAGMHV